MIPAYHKRTCTLSSETEGTLVEIMYFYLLSLSKLAILPEVNTPYE